MYYILDGKTPVAEPDSAKFGRWLESADRKVRKTKIGECTVSTVFLGVDYSFGGPPLLFETRVFGGPLDQELERCGTWAVAESNHDAMCERVRQSESQS